MKGTRLQNKQKVVLLHIFGYSNMHVQVVYTIYGYSVMQESLIINTSGKNHFHEMNGDVGMARWK